MQNYVLNEGGFYRIKAEFEDLGLPRTIRVIRRNITESGMSVHQTIVYQEIGEVKTTENVDILDKYDSIPYDI